MEWETKTPCSTSAVSKSGQIKSRGAAPKRSSYQKPEPDDGRTMNTNLFLFLLRLLPAGPSGPGRFAPSAPAAKRSRPLVDVQFLLLRHASRSGNTLFVSTAAAAAAAAGAVLLAVMNGGNGSAARCRCRGSGSGTPLVGCLVCGPRRLPLACRLLAPCWKNIVYTRVSNTSRSQLIPW